MKYLKIICFLQNHGLKYIGDNKALTESRALLEEIKID